MTRQTRYSIDPVSRGSRPYETSGLFQSTYRATTEDTSS